jgi:hypothetical protein
MSLSHQHFENMLHRQPLAIDFGFLFHRDIHPKHRQELLNWIYQVNLDKIGKLNPHFSLYSLLKSFPIMI